MINLEIVSEILEGATQGVFLLKGEQIIYANAYCRTILGLDSVSDNNSVNIYDFVMPAYHDELKDTLYQCIQEPQKNHIRYLQCTVNKEIYEIKGHIRLIKNTDDDLISFYIDQIVPAESNEPELNELLQAIANSQTPFALLDNSLTIKYCNKSFLGFRDKSLDKVVNKPLIDKTQDRELYETIQSHLGKNMLWQGEISHPGSDEIISELATIQTIPATETCLYFSQNISLQKQAESRIKQLNKQLNFHYHHTPLGYIKWSKDAVVEDWNQSSEKIFGYTATQIIGKKALNKLIPGIPDKQLHIWWHNILLKSDNRDTTIVSTNYKGDMIFCNWYNTPLRNEHGQIAGMISLIQDKTVERLTERNLERNKRALEALINANNDIVFLLDDKLRVITANAKAADYFVTPLNVLHNRNIIDFDFRNEEREFLEELKQLRNERKKPRNYINHRNIDGRDYAYEIYPITDNKGTLERAAVFIRDITLSASKYSKIQTLKHSTKIFHQAQIELLQPLFNEFTAKAEKLYNHINRFQKIKNQLNEESLAILSTMKSDFVHYGLWINSLRNYFSLTEISRKIDRKYIKVAGIIEKAVQKMKLQYPNRKIINKMYGNAQEVFSDADIIEEILTYLLDNALKFSNDQVDIILLNQGNHVIVTIHDRGIGIARNELPNIFELFYKARNAKQYKGYGLGLPMVKYLTLLIDADINVESQYNKETICKIRIPIA